MNFTLDELQAAAVAAPADSLLIVTGAPGSGKTTTLVARAQSSGKGLAASPRFASCERLRDSLGESMPIMTLEGLGLLVLETSFARAGLAALQQVDEVDASIIFERAAEPLFLMEWAEFIEAQIDPEVPGLRAPQRFLEAAFRLISKLRDAQMAPATFLEVALRGATQFYARPPNLAHPDLLYYTKDSYRDSLDVDSAELARQHRREVDLAKILEKLYRSYLDLLDRTGQYTGSDAVAESTQRLAGDAALRTHFIEQFPVILVDDAQELSGGELALLQAMRGPALPGVSLFGDPGSAIGTFSGARPDRVFALQATRIALEHTYRSAAVIERAARHLSGADALDSVSLDGKVVLFRGATKKAEAAFVAEQVIDLLNDGVPPSEIAVLFRSVANVQQYEAALLDRNVDVQITGDLNIFTTPDILDALALLWNIYDPFAHEWMLRTLSGHAFALSDASLVTLCSEPDAGQALLFEELAEAETNRRWDRKRDLRLGWNVVCGDQDRALSDQARARVQEFRALRERWTTDLARLELSHLAAKVFREGLAYAAPRLSARARNQERNIRRLLDRIAEFTHRLPNATLADFLDYTATRMTTSLEACEERVDRSLVRIMSISAAMGDQFDHVILPNVRAGSFPHYYVPDAFLFSPSLGMIAKENVGDAKASRTAKFTYYMFRAKTRESYNREERRAFVYALRRARRSVTVTASERPTRGITSPEFLSELQAARLAGSVDISDRWRPANSVYVTA
ncbi:MAG: AAA family ATPase [Candidatus Eremiobacteraeota bacterium]|nr:AAA family ATPase [Candidatus Eremiobacteraeota bacterium]